MNEIEVKNRIKQFINERNLTINSISRDSSIQVRLSRQINGDTALSFATLDYILEVFPTMSAEWLMRGTGEPEIDEWESASVLGSDGDRRDDEQGVPVISADLYRKTDTNIVSYINSNIDNIEHGTLEEQMPAYDMVFRAVDNAMDPYISKGDVMALKKVPVSYINEALVYLIDTPMGCFVRRVYKEDGAFILKSSHPKYPPIRVQESDIFNALLVVIVQRYSLTPSAITLEDIEARDQRIMGLEHEKDKLLDEAIKYGGRIDKLLDIMENQNQKGDARIRATYVAAER